MITITKERLQWLANISGRDDIDDIDGGEIRELALIALASLEAEPVAVNDDMAYAFHHALSDSSPGADEVEEIKAGLRAAFANVTTQPAPVVPEFETWFNSQESGRSICSTQIRRSLQEISWNACCAAMLQGVEPASQTYKLNELSGNSPVTPDSWISCSERMPKGYADVLVTDGEHVEVKWWDESGYWNSWTELNSDIFADEITHWMPLPEPPQEVNRG